MYKCVGIMKETLHSFVFSQYCVTYFVFYPITVPFFKINVPIEEISGKREACWMRGGGRGRRRKTPKTE